jgi:hypothetical protein
LTDLNTKTLKKALGLRKNHLKQNLHEVTLIPPLEYWADYLVLINIIKIKSKTEHDIEILNNRYNEILNKYNIQPEETQPENIN